MSKQKSPEPDVAAIQCPVCGGDAYRDTRFRTVAYKDLSVEIEQPGWYCDRCHEVILEGDDASLANFAFEELRAEAEGLPLSAAAVAALRKATGLSQRKASELLGGGRNAFQRYESGRAAISKGMANLLTLLAANPRLVEHLPSNDDVLRIQREHMDERLTRIMDRVHRARESRRA